MKKLKWRVLVILSSCLFALYLLLPTFLKLKYDVSIPKISKQGDPWYTHVLPSEVLKLGLDLMGGLHLVMGIDFNEINRDAVTKLKRQMEELSQRVKLTGLTFEVSKDLKVVVHFNDESQWKELDKQIAREMGQMIDLESQGPHEARLKMTSTQEADSHRRAMDQSLETLRNRIDEFGIAEPIIQRQGEDKILVQFPGVQEVGRLKEIIARTAKLSYQIEVSGPEAPGGPPSFEELNRLVSEYVKQTKIPLTSEKPISSYTKELNVWLEKKIPPGTEVLFHKQVDINTKQTTYVPYLLSSEEIVTGEDLQDAYYGFDPETNEATVFFHLTPVGAIKFERATGENVGKMMAIVLDNNVYSAPRIIQKIAGGRARITMGETGRSDQDRVNDAKDTALVLRSGALPARLEFLEERTVGPSLGADAIRAGTISLILGVALVFLFMAIYYRFAGLVADLALILNGLFIFSALAAFEGTLTLPGLAGITLTLGIAVDANVLIFEHIREELRYGKSLQMALSEGYQRAFTAIFDSHVTAIIAAIVLLSFGYGPIRGFAVTLLIGLAASLFTAVFVTRVILDYWVIYRRKTTISI